MEKSDRTAHATVSASVNQATVACTEETGIGATPQKLTESSYYYIHSKLSIQDVGKCPILCLTITFMTQKPRILLVEDEPGIADTLQYVLSTDGFLPVWCSIHL